MLMQKRASLSSLLGRAVVILMKFKFPICRAEIGVPHSRERGVLDHRMIRVVNWPVVIWSRWLRIPSGTHRVLSSGTGPEIRSRWVSCNHILLMRSGVLIGTHACIVHATVIVNAWVKLHGGVIWMTLASSIGCFSRLRICVGHLDTIGDHSFPDRPKSVFVVISVVSGRGGRPEKFSVTFFFGFSNPKSWQDRFATTLSLKIQVTYCKYKKIVQLQFVQRNDRFFTSIFIALKVTNENFGFARSLVLLRRCFQIRRCQVQTRRSQP